MKKLLALVAAVACTALLACLTPASAQTYPDWQAGTGVTQPHVATVPTAPTTSAVTLPIRFDIDGAGALVTLGASQWLAQYTLPALERTWIGAGANSAIVRRANTAAIRRR